MTIEPSFRAAIRPSRRLGPSWLRAAAIVATLALLGPGEPAAAVDDDRSAEWRDALLHTYVHGVTEPTARELLGREAVPYLHDLLTDASFPRRDNVVAFLARLGDERSTQPLLRLPARGGTSRRTCARC